MRGQALRVEDPFVIAEIIDELNSRRIESLQNNDYRSAKKVKDTIENTRMQFRQHERDLLHREIVGRLDAHYKDALAAAAAAKDDWKAQRRKMAEDQRAELMELAARQEDEHRQLEVEWVQPETVRKFDKRSSTLLQNRQIEQYLMLCGNYPGADQMKRINSQTEKVEIEHRRAEMRAHFEIARANLNMKHGREAEKLKMEQESMTKVQAENEKKDLAAKARRVEATQRVLTEEKDFEKFIRKKVHRPADSVMPPTLLTIRDGGEDLPALSFGKSAPPGVAPMAELGSKSVVTRLPLPPLTIKHYHPPPLVKAPKPKKSDV
jgi:hypothetical protein